ncbi:Asp-tRNA(Asn)/Glu-tRNA(Gln) amidotransferase subunit GatA [Patescibacteria group bacterium]|nr:Asp-tRNA(Asn)/Glu-tRNA(Gln) amidotransferase subunit GatA [Patescibacteria group bacterium]MBU1673621.1 Asp-tRNA(Asn)/Glu-tRNA(Gln) amidotransferase subunit GatA [Patescibacteria group bacterium]MBU1963891.1 Asp-tRNA(Asn)/Glu-tRNA(Gln) amidotransferase subunit GatA [Patescibacteria group bacterium]
MIKELRAKLDSGETSSQKLVEEYFDNIKKLDKDLNAFISADKEKALERAGVADKTIKKGEADMLTGIPFATKDNYCVKHYKTTAGSKILEDYKPPYSATAIKKLEECPLLGKTNCDEFAMGASGENSAYGPTKNPHGHDHVAGGSSSGSAAAVAAGMAPFALGTDTGGSVRLPASFCGIVGLRPTYGRISRYGIIAMASSLDVVGTLTQTVEDAAIVLDNLAGQDSLDSTTPPIKKDDYLKEIEKDIKGMKIGVPIEYINAEGIDEKVKKEINEAIAKFKDMGAEVEEMSLPHTEYAVATYYIIVSSEVSSNLARYDGVKYGLRIPGETLEQMYTDTRTIGFGWEVERRILMGTFSLSAGYQDKYYQKAQKVRTLIKQDFDKAFKKYDILLTPTSPTPAFKLGEKTKDPLSMYLMDVFTAPSSLAGVPALSVPAGSVDGLPIGLQLIGPQFGERRILRAGHKLLP